MTEMTEIYTVITLSEDDELGTWSFKTQEEADEFAEKIQELDATLRVEYNYIRGFEHSVDDALTDFKEWLPIYVAEEAWDKEFEEGEPVCVSIPPESLCGKFIRENNPTTDEIIQFLAYGTSGTH